MKQSLAIIAVMLCATAFAQKPSLNKAKSAMDKGNLEEAKMIIDQAIDYDKTKDKAKTWFYRGMIYAQLDTVSNEPGSFQTAVDAFNKALELDPDQKTTQIYVGITVENVDNQVSGYYTHYYSKGVASYEAEEFNSAADNFEKAYYIYPHDTVSMQNAAYAALQGEDHKRAKMNFRKAIDAGMKDVNIFLRLLTYEIDDKNFDEAFAVLTKAREIYPDNYDFLTYQINILVQQGKSEEAKVSLEEAIAQEPNNADLHFSLGVIKEDLDDVEGARASYANALEIDNNHYGANFNLGVLVFNDCNELIKERNATDYKEKEKYQSLSRQIDEKLRIALPYWEKLYSLKSEEETVVNTLKYIYNGLKMTDKASQISDGVDG